MGQATIVEAIGEGLYRAKPVWDFTRINLELLALQGQQEAYLITIVKALTAKDLIEKDVRIAADALNAVIKQWKQALIDKMKTAGPLTPPEPVDPGTGEPWEDPDRAQEPVLLTAINAARSAASAGNLTRNHLLDTAALRYLRYQSNTNRTGHMDEVGRQPADRVKAVGYGAGAVDELLAYGETTPADVVTAWQREASTRAVLLGADWVDVGIAYLYSRTHYAAHLWCVVVAEPGVPPPSVGDETKDKDPVTEKAVEAEGKLNRVSAPKLDNLSPDQLGAAAQAYGIAIAKLRAAEREIERLTAENLAREKRITLLESIKNTPATIDVWCVDYDESLTVGATVDSMEVPGFWKQPGNARTSVLYKDTSREKTVSWIERSWNLAAGGKLGQPTGILTPAEAMTDAAVFVNCALEPGHLKWKPLWRYGVITAMAGGMATVSFAEENARVAKGDLAVSLQRFYHYAGIPIRYPPCGPGVFAVDDEVFVLFEGTNRDQPVIIGFRREPKTCPGRQTWKQL